MRLPFVLGFTLALAGAGTSAPALKEPPGNDPNLIGEWVLERLELGGKPTSLDGVAVRTEFTADGKRVTRNRGGEVIAERLYTLGRDRVPPRIDIRAADGEAVALRGIYSVSGEKLTVAYVTDDAADRPAKLESPAGSKVYLGTYRRMKKQVQDD
ncbi:MAG TPA: TIGR03067 domain-containing protein [Gemmataceae bacterium]|jgi:uncharacterized protein (TIGR03067 family)|nr:TIGR03067 domain-containing protein [Gemmataceae bacterium]